MAIRTSFEDCAKAAYQAYGETTDFKNFRGDPMPTWETLPDGIKYAWETAAAKVYDIATSDLNRPIGSK